MCDFRAWKKRILMLISWLIFWGCVPSTNEQCFSLICLVADGADKPLLNCFDQSNPKKNLVYCGRGMGWVLVQTCPNTRQREWAMESMESPKFARPKKIVCGGCTCSILTARPFYHPSWVRDYLQWSTKWGLQTLCLLVKFHHEYYVSIINHQKLSWMFTNLAITKQLYII